MEITPG